MLGVVDHDLYVPELNFVFGLASGAVAVIGLARLRQEFYSLPPGPGRLPQRALTEAVHELGHTYGLPQCRNPKCVIFFSNALGDTEIEKVLCLARAANVSCHEHRTHGQCCGDSSRNAS